MKCFNHHTTDAIAICRACSKALCTECLVDLGYSISCKGSCEKKAELIESLLSKGAATVTAQKKNRYFLPVFFVFFGVVFFVTGIIENYTFGLVSGVGFVAFGVFYTIATRKLAKELKNA